MLLINQLARLPVGLSLFLIALSDQPRAAFRALLTRVAGKRVRAMNILRRATVEKPILYKIWRHKIEPGRMARNVDLDDHAAPRVIWALFEQPGKGPDAIAKTLASLPGRPDGRDVLLVTSTGQRPSEELPLQHVDIANLGETIAALQSESPEALFIPVRCRDKLAAGATQLYVDAFDRSPDATLIYGDEDEMDEDGERDTPWFKPDWNEQQFLSQDFVSGACAIPIRLISPTVALSGASDPVSALAYQVALDRPEGPFPHIPLILSHRGSRDRVAEDISLPALIAARLAPGTRISTSRAGTRRVDWPMPNPAPRVTAIVPTRDRLPLLQTCLDGLATTDYPALDVIVIDNESVEPASLVFFEALRGSGTSVMKYPGPFNFAAMNNAAAQAASGTLLCFVNNDIEFRDRHWLTALVRQAARPQAGAVGAKLLYPDGSIQHAGVAIGIGGAAGHIHKHKPDGSDACHGEPHVQRQVSAVTAACMLVSKAKFLEVGGFDAQNFGVAFNDVDLCLKLQAAGYRNCYEPHAMAIHHESVSRGSDFTPANIARYQSELAALQRKWETLEATDPNWNVNLDYSCEQMSIRL